MKSELLLKLADLLDALPPERFDYSQWADNHWDGKPLHACRTSACALGWATTIPEAGLELRRWNGSIGVARKGSALPEGHRHFSFSVASAASAFEISIGEAEDLFVPGDAFDDGPDEFASANEVAAHIRRFVKAKS